jgi:hypothetical protein
MKERPILFSGKMVRAILANQKTQTRRVIKPQPAAMTSGTWYPSEIPGDARNRTGLHYASEEHFRKGMPLDFSPYGHPGDQLWVRETWAVSPFLNTVKPSKLPKNSTVWYRADGTEDGSHVVWRPSIFMPRWASRITLEIQNIRVDLLQFISDDDCCLETGAPLEWSGPGPEPYKRDMQKVFAYEWDKINSKRGFGWDTNPWVWVIEFKRV